MSEGESIFLETELLALILGYNELAKKSKNIGQRVYMRMCRAEAEKSFREVGGEFDIREPESAVMVVHNGAYVRFFPRDIEQMREAVRMFDAGELPTVDGPEPLAIARAEAAADERAKVVAYLREEARKERALGLPPRPDLSESSIQGDELASYADLIEQGYHHGDPNGGSDGETD